MTALNVPSNSSIHTLKTYINRDLSLLEFHKRVLAQAKDTEYPLLERLNFLIIFSRNLDEFFEVRMVLHLNSQTAKNAELAKRYQSISSHAHELVARQYEIYNHSIEPALAEQKIRIVSNNDRTQAQKAWVKQHFATQVQPLLIPVGLDPAHPFPQIASKSLNFIVRLSGRDAFGRENEIAIVKVPRVLPRLIRLPEKISNGEKLFVSLSSVIRSHLEDLFPGRNVGQFSQFRVTRNSELSVDEEEVANLRTALRLGLEHRNFGQAMRVEVSSGCSDYLAHFLLKQFNLPEMALYRVHGLVNLVRLNQLIDLVPQANLLFKPYHASFPRQLIHAESIFTRLQQSDVLIHQPFESFVGVLAFLREAVHDKNVLAIKQTIYRTGADSELMDLLREAIRRGKEVTVVVEIKARFDEETNINWAERLESIGAQVVYGVVGLKTHAKMLLVTRREGKKLVRYAHLSTGNYNSNTARLYTDLSFLTAQLEITQDVENIFVHLAGQNKLPKLQHIILAPTQLHTHLLNLIKQTADAAQKGRNARIVLKVNAFTDDQLAWALIKANHAGVKIDLIVRGACILPAELKHQTENIHVRSVIGRFLEHSRIFYFLVDEQETLLLSSADCMNRNMLRRIELAWPIHHPALRQQIIDECLSAYLHDTQDAWNLSADGSYEKLSASRTTNKISLSAQNALMQKYSKI
jgi:polyphosphate kinase